jgi:hypothetical protein
MTKLESDIEFLELLEKKLRIVENYLIDGKEIPSYKEACSCKEIIVTFKRKILENKDNTEVTLIAFGLFDAMLKDVIRLENKILDGKEILAYRDVCRIISGVDKYKKELIKINL